MKILVYRYGQIGDTIAGIPSLRALRRQFPGARLTLVSEVPTTGDSLPPDRVLPAGVVDEYLKYRAGVSFGSLPHIARFLFSLRRRKFHLLAYLAPSTRDANRRRRDAFFFKLAGLKRIIGMKGFPADPFPRSPDGRLVDVQHEADALLSRLAVDGIDVPAAGAAEIDLQLTGPERTAAETWLIRHLSRTPRRWFAVAPGTKWASKRWPLERYVEVARRLCGERGLIPVVVGGREDREQGLQLVAACGAGACAAGELDVRESAALLEQALFYVGNDSGPMHLAAAVGTPCVGVFSAQDWRGRWHPYGSGHEVLRADVPCAGCFSATCARHLECLTNIAPADVYAACLRAADRNSAARPSAADAQVAIA